MILKSFYRVNAVAVMLATAWVATPSAAAPSASQQAQMERAAAALAKMASTEKNFRNPHPAPTTTHSDNASNTTGPKRVKSAK